MQQPCCVNTTWLLFAAVVGFCFVFAAVAVGICFVFAAVAVGFCFVFAVVFLCILLCAWSMYPEFALCLFQDDISGPHAS